MSSLQGTVSKLKPPQEFFDHRRLSKPANFGEVQSRVAYNLGYFHANYILIVSILSVYALVTNLLLLFVIALVGGGIFGISRLNGQDLVLPVGRFTTSQLYTALIVVAVPLGFGQSNLHHDVVDWLPGSVCLVARFVHGEAYRDSL